MSNIEQQIEATNKQLEKLKAKKKALQAKERNAKRVQKRKDETRKKILLGALVQRYFAEGGRLTLRISRSQINTQTIEQFLEVLCTSPKDREFLQIKGESDMHNAYKYWQDIIGKFHGN